MTDSGISQEYERAVIFRLGRLLSGGARGPGVTISILHHCHYHYHHICHHRHFHLRRLLFGGARGLQYIIIFHVITTIILTCESQVVIFIIFIINILFL